MSIVIPQTGVHWVWDTSGNSLRKNSSPPVLGSWALCLCVCPGAHNDRLHSPYAQSDWKKALEVWTAYLAQSFFTWDFKVTFTCPKQELLTILKAQWGDQAKLWSWTAVKHPLTGGSQQHEQLEFILWNNAKAFSPDPSTIPLECIHRNRQKFILNGKTQRDKKGEKMWHEEVKF